MIECNRWDKKNIFRYKDFIMSGKRSLGKGKRGEREVVKLLQTVVDEVTEELGIETVSAKITAKPKHNLITSFIGRGNLNNKLRGVRIYKPSIITKEIQLFIFRRSTKIGTRIKPNSIPP